MRIVALQLGSQVLRRPIRQRRRQILARGLDPVCGAILFGTARQHIARIPIQIAQQLGLPIVPDPRSDTADIANGQNQ